MFVLSLKILTALLQRKVSAIKSIKQDGGDTFSFSSHPDFLAAQNCFQLTEDLPMTFFIDFLFQVLKPPWLKFMTSVPFLAILIAHTCEGWGFSTMQTCLPKYLTEALGMRIVVVSELL